MRRHVYAFQICTCLLKYNIYAPSKPKAANISLDLAGENAKVYFFRCVNSLSFWDPFGELQMRCQWPESLGTYTASLSLGLICFHWQLALVPPTWLASPLLAVHRAFFQIVPLFFGPTHPAGCHHAESWQQGHGFPVPAPGSISSIPLREGEQLNMKTHLWFMRRTLWSPKLTCKSRSCKSILLTFDLHTILNNSEGGVRYKQMRVYRLLTPLHHRDSS